MRRLRQRRPACRQAVLAAWPRTRSPSAPLSCPPWPGLPSGCGFGPQSNRPMGQWTSIEVLGLVLDGVAALAVLVWLVWARKRLAADTVHAREQAAQILAQCRARGRVACARKPSWPARSGRTPCWSRPSATARDIHDAARSSRAARGRAAAQRRASARPRCSQREQDLIRRQDEVQQRQAAAAALDQQVRRPPGAGRGAACRGRPRTAARGRAHRRRGPRRARPADGARRAPRRRAPRQAPRGRGARAGRRQGPPDHHRSHPAQRRRARHRDHRLGRRPARATT